MIQTVGGSLKRSTRFRGYKLGDGLLANWNSSLLTMNDI